MTRDPNSSAVVRALRRIALLGAIAALFQAPLGCTGKGGGSGCLLFEDGTVIEFDFDEEGGFDDTSSPGAALGVAVDDTGNFQALVIGLRFTSITTEQTYTPTCNTNDAITTYDFGETNSVTDDIAGDHPMLTQALTDTAGILAMQHTMNALLVTYDAENGLRYFLAVGGSITLRRTLGASPENRITGTLNFVELTGATNADDIAEDAELLLLEDIDFTWDTSEQPT